MKKRIIGRLGDVNPIDYGGGVVIDRGYGPEVEFTHGLEEIEGVDQVSDRALAKVQLTVYRTDVPNDLLTYHGWVDWNAVANSIDMDANQLRSEAQGQDVMKRVYVLWTVANYYGWHELDHYPIQLTPGKLRQRWRLR